MTSDASTLEALARRNAELIIERDAALAECKRLRALLGRCRSYLGLGPLALDLQREIAAVVVDLIPGSD